MHLACDPGQAGFGGAFRLRLDGWGPAGLRCSALLLCYCHCHCHCHCFCSARGRLFSHARLWLGPTATVGYASGRRIQPPSDRRTSHLMKSSGLLLLFVGTASTCRGLPGEAGYVLGIQPILPASPLRSRPHHHTTPHLTTPHHATHTTHHTTHTKPPRQHQPSTGCQIIVTSAPRWPLPPSATLAYWRRTT